MTRPNAKNTSKGLIDLSFRDICDSIPAMVAVYNIHTGQYLYVNKAVRKLLGYEPQDFIKKGIAFASSLIHPDDLEAITSKNQEALTKANKIKAKDDSLEPIISFEYRIRHKDGHYVWMHTDGSIYSRKNGKVESVLNASLDITVHKQDVEKLSQAEAKRDMQNKLQASEDRYQAFINNSREGIWRVELEKPISVHLPTHKQIKLMYKYGYLAEANKAMADMYGFSTLDEIIGARLNDLLVESDPNNHAYLEAFIQSGYNLTNAESHEIDSKGSHKYFSNSLVGIIEGDTIVRAWGTQVDITEQKLAAEALKKSEESLARALNASKLGMWEWDMKTGELVWSDQQKKIFGLHKSEKITYEKYVQMLYPQDAPKMKKTILSSQKTGKSYQIEHRVVWPDGSIHWLVGQGRAIFEDGKPVRMAGTSMNIDERKKATELELQTKQLIAERKLLLELNTAKDEFISIASHQLRTPATGVKQYLGMILQGHSGPLRLSPEQLAMLHTAYESNERQIHIVGELLKTAQVDAGTISLQAKQIDVIKLIRHIADDLKPCLNEKKQSISISPREKSITAFIDADRMQMALENIIDNACKYSATNTQIRITVKDGKKQVAIHVSDQGVGIAKKDQKKLFLKFSRIQNPLSAHAGGSGLGLYWVKKIVTQHGGDVTVKSHINKGTTFIITLPKNRSTALI